MRVLRPIMIAALLTGCSSGHDKPVQEVIARSDGDGVQRIEVVAHSYWFEPNRIVVRAGVPVEMHVKNGALLVPHNLSCDTAGVDIDADVGIFGGDQRVRFTPATPGEYRFACHVKGHAKKGMTGTLVVQP